jgi:hypothetical protein
MGDGFVLPEHLPSDTLSDADLVLELGDIAVAVAARQASGERTDAWLDLAASEAVNFRRYLLRERARRAAQQALADWKPDPLGRRATAKRPEREDLLGQWAVQLAQMDAEY